MKRVGTVVLGIVIVVALAGFVTKPSRLTPPTEPFTLSDDPDSHLSKTEAAAEAEYPLTPGAEKRIVWAGEAGERTTRVVIYIHGFSATRQEIAPIPELVAASLGANLFETRLAGHGRLDNGPLVANAEDWLDDGAEVLAIGKELGDELILIGTSTGATVAVAMANHPDFKMVDSLVLVSPNFGTNRAGSSAMTGPFGPQITRAVVGEYTSWEPANELQSRYWTWHYPSATLVQLMRLVNLAVSLVPETTVDNAMLVYSPQDDVISVEKALSNFAAMPVANKHVHRVDNPDSLSPHVLSGDILAPGTSEAMASEIVSFLNP